MYDPILGRWLEQDPIGLDAGDMNLYRMEGNNPVNTEDPSGIAPPQKKKPEWIPYMKGIEIQSKFKDVGDLRDELDNRIKIFRATNKMRPMA